MQALNPTKTSSSRYSRLPGFPHQSKTTVKTTSNDQIRKHALFNDSNPPLPAAVALALALAAPDSPPVADADEELVSPVLAADIVIEVFFVDPVSTAAVEVEDPFSVDVVPAATAEVVVVVEDTAANAAPVKVALTLSPVQIPRYEELHHAQSVI